MLALGLPVFGVLAGCDRRSDVGPVIASVIGEPPVLADPARQALGRPSQMLMAGVAQGLVRLDATGQVEPGIAERWIVIDAGMSYKIGRASCRERVCQYV